MTKFELERVKYMISQAEKQTYVNMNKGDAVILKRLLEPKLNEVIWNNHLDKIIDTAKVNSLKLVEDNKAGTFEEMLDKVNKGEKL